MVAFERFGKMSPKTRAKHKLEQYVSQTFNSATIFFTVKKVSKWCKSKYENSFK